MRAVLFFFFSSRRRHTRFKCDWSSDVCSSDLDRMKSSVIAAMTPGRASGSTMVCTVESVRSEERRVGKSVDLGGRRIIKKKKKKKKEKQKKKKTKKKKV